MTTVHLHNKLGLRVAQTGAMGWPMFPSPINPVLLMFDLSKKDRGSPTCGLSA